MAVAQLPLLAEVAEHRTSAYASSAAAIALLGATSLALGTRRFGLDALGLAWTNGEAVVGWTVALLLFAGALVIASFAAGRFLKLEETPVLRDLLPRTARERWWFRLLSVCAGTGEELAYRGYATLVLWSLTGSPLAAVLVANVPFALVHVYQGRIGLVRTYLLGVALGVSFLYTRSLWPAMISHTVIDLAGGSVWGQRLLDLRSRDAD